MFRSLDGPLWIKPTYLLGPYWAFKLLGPAWLRYALRYREEGFFRGRFPRAAAKPRPRRRRRRRRLREHATAARSNHPLSADTPSSFLSPRTSHCFWFPCGRPMAKRLAAAEKEVRPSLASPSQTGQISLLCLPLD